MEQKTIIERAYNYTSELLSKNKVDITTTTGKTIRVDYTIEEDGDFTIYSITSPYSTLEQEVYEIKDANGNVIKRDNKFNTGLVHSHIIGIMRNY
jgi:hypothetical protein